MNQLVLSVFSESTTDVFGTAARLCPFATEDEAEAMLAKVRLEYPCALCLLLLRDCLHRIGAWEDPLRRCARTLRSRTLVRHLLSSILVNYLPLPITPCDGAGGPQ